MKKIGLRWRRIAGNSAEAKAVGKIRWSGVYASRVKESVAPVFPLYLLLLLVCSFLLVSVSLLFRFSARLFRFSVAPLICFSAVLSAFCLFLLLVSACSCFCFSALLLFRLMLRSYAPPLFCLSASRFFFHPHPSRAAPL